MKRGEIWTAAGGPSDYAGKPRPVLILQDDAFSGGNSVVVVPFTTDPTVAPLLRLPVRPDPGTNNLSRPSSLMVDKLMAAPRDKLGRYVGRLDAQQMAKVNSMVATLLGLARPAGSRGGGGGRVRGQQVTITGRRAAVIRDAPRRDEDADDDLP